MSLLHRISHVFSARTIPNIVVEKTHAVTTEQNDLNWFVNRDWKSITWDDWEKHRDAIYAFSPEAFSYYLPSILSLSITRPGIWFFPADALLGLLDRSPTVEYWDTFLTTRLVGLQMDEYEILKEWLLLICEYRSSEYSESISRAFDTVNLLQKETLRVRSMVHSANRLG